MKKITLVLLAIVAFSMSGFSQATFTVEAPAYDGSSWALAGPSAVTNGGTTYAAHKACWLLTQAEVARLAQTNSVVTEFGFDLLRAGNVNAPGNFTLYLQNTSDIAYSQGTNFATIAAGMSTNYVGAMTVPGSTSSGTTSINVTLGAPFTYTGGGIYVAYEWAATAASQTAFAVYIGASDQVALGAMNTTTLGGAITTLTSSTIRPIMRLKATNTATNDVCVVQMVEPGAVSKLAGPQTLSAIIRNNSTASVNNVPVTMTITGANPATLTTTITTAIPAGATVNVNFPAYTPTANGTSTMIVLTGNDQYNANNINALTGAQTQSVGCSDYANHWTFPANTFTDGSYGYGTPAMLVTPYYAANTTSIGEIKFVPSSNTVSICGVLLDGSGNLLATTNTLAAATPSAYTNNMKFTPPYELTGGTDYYYGIAQINSGFVFATNNAPATMNLNLYYYSPLGGGSIGGAQNQMGYVAMNAVTIGTNMALSATASQSLFCKGDASTLTLNAIGSLTTYTWTRNGTGGGVISTSAANAVVTPTIPTSIPSGTGTITYSVIGVDAASGCRSNGVTITVTVSACTAIADNNTDGYNISVYPNPAVNSIATINGLVGTNEITVFNMVGQSVRTFKTNQESTELDLSGLPSGNYIVKITGDNKQTRMVKIMK